MHAVTGLCSGLPPWIARRLTSGCSPAEMLRAVLEEAKGHVEKQLNRSLPPNFIKIQRMRAPRDRQQQQEQAA